MLTLPYTFSACITYAYNTDNVFRILQKRRAWIEYRYSVVLGGGGPLYASRGRKLYTKNLSHDHRYSQRSAAAASCCYFFFSLHFTHRDALTRANAVLQVRSPLLTQISIYNIYYIFGRFVEQLLFVVSRAIDTYPGETVCTNVGRE